MFNIADQNSPLHYEKRLEPDMSTLSHRRIAHASLGPVRGILGQTLRQHNVKITRKCWTFDSRAGSIFVANLANQGQRILTIKGWLPRRRFV